ncbi:MAG TPA: FkbM family methyltransferase [Vicinamibacterales bacterium]|nr:FkbM family methyltransferase [Vicinamibacterales bacterium]
MKRLDWKELLEAVRALSPSKRAVVIEALQNGLTGDTPEGLHVTARTRKELGRLVRERDPDVVAWMRDFEPAAVFYDIGANCGSLTLTAAALHRPDIRIVAIEPSFASFESLVRNLSLNGLLACTIPLQVALLDRTGLEPMNYRSVAAGTSLHGVGEAVDYMGEPFTPIEVQMVPTYRLDDLIEMQKLPVPTRMKIDVDGFEASVLRGATCTLAAGTIRDLLIEVVDHDGAGSRLAEITAFLNRHGYDMATVLQHSAGAGTTPSIVADYLFRHRE